MTHIVTLDARDSARASVHSAFQAMVGCRVCLTQHLDLGLSQASIYTLYYLEPKGSRLEKMNKFCRRFESVTIIVIEILFN